MLYNKNMIYIIIRGTASYMSVFSQIHRGIRRVHTGLFEFAFQKLLGMSASEYRKIQAEKVQKK